MPIMSQVDCERLWITPFETEKEKVNTLSHLVWEVMSELEIKVKRLLTIQQLWIMDMSWQVVK